MDGPVALLLLPRAVDEFILRDQARDLLLSPQVVAAGPPRLRYGVFGRLPAAASARLARTVAERVDRLPAGQVRMVMIFHPLQLPVAEAVLERRPEAELWYSRWDRYEMAYDASPALRRRLAELHERAARRASVVLAASGRLAELEREAGREAVVAPPPHDSFPAPDPAGAVIALSLGHLGRRTDWELLAEVARRMPELVVLLVGERHDDECPGDPGLAACLALPNLVFLGRLDDEAAARLLVCADVGVVPFKDEPFNDAGLPQRIMKYARVGRRTIAPDLAGVRTWERAVTRADGPDAWVAALRACAGTRTRPDAGLREWALAQTARHQNRPLWERLAALGIPEPPAGA